MKIKIQEGELKKAVIAQSLSFEKFSRRCDLAARTIFRANKGVGITQLSYQKICAALGYNLDDFITVSE